MLASVLLEAEKWKPPNLKLILFFFGSASDVKYFLNLCKVHQKAFTKTDLMTLS